ncbi:amiloride-sensitive sodium channel subunit gamma [Plakobranchus ocellatus]|uniref:Amiloride-sensitive sodium channel subunit gamma n=1 Tax=Plakobranchus ocellatus TaxID=259542 RepID=A0AAV4CJ52_9GAST|nr:amiloride-sensitive sodium channel subunit gamma [Plakobranchus ocellatus]
MHGVQHVMGHRSVWRRIVWSVLVIGFVAWAAHNVYQIVSDYNNHPVQTSVSSEYQGKMNFPAVTICNLNRIRRSKTSHFLLQVIQMVFKRGMDVAGINYHYIDHFLRQFGRQQLRAMGHQMQDMLVKCKFGNTRIKRLSSPYSNCIDKVDFNNKEKNLFAERGFAYSLKACQKSCVQKHIYKFCQCCDVSFPCIEDTLQRSTGIIAREGNRIPICNTTVPKTTMCIEKIEKDFSDNKLGCIKNCPPACEESSFSTTVSSAPWPNRDYRQTLLWQHGLDQNVTQLLEAAESTFLKLEIYYDSLILEKVVNQPAFTWNKLLCDIGGQLGLLLGFSILTAVEILELVVMDLGLGIGLRLLGRFRIQKQNGRQEVAAPQIFCFSSRDSVSLVQSSVTCPAFGSQVQPLHLQSSPVSLGQSLHFQSSPVSLGQSLHLQSSPVSLVQPLHLQSSPVSLVQPLHLQYSSVSLAQPLHLQSSPVSLVQPLHLQSNPVSLVQPLCLLSSSEFVIQFLHLLVHAVASRRPYVSSLLQPLPFCSDPFTTPILFPLVLILFLQSNLSFLE